MESNAGFLKKKVKTLNRNKMKQVKVNAYQVGLVFKNGEYKKMVLAGSYWFWSNETVYVYDVTRPSVHLLN